MYLHNTMALDFLTILGTKDFQQLQELWISTFGISDDSDYPQLSATISNFNYLKSLHLILPFIQLDTKLVFTKCKRITNLSILCDSVLTNNLRGSFEQIRRYALNLKQMQIYQYKDLLSVKDWWFLVSIFSNVKIQSIHIDMHGKCSSMNRITAEWLQTLTDYDF